MRALVLHGFGDAARRGGPRPGPRARARSSSTSPASSRASPSACSSPGTTVAMHDVARRAGSRPGRPASAVTSSPASSAPRPAADDLAAGGPGHRRGDRRLRHLRRLPPGPSRRLPSPGVLGFTRPGAFAERVAVPAQSVVAVPDGVTASQAAAVQPLAGALHGHAIAEVRPGDSVLILGAGVMGVLHAQVARHGGAGQIVVTGRSAAKRRLAPPLGADLVFDAADDVHAAVAGGHRWHRRGRGVRDGGWHRRAPGWPARPPWTSRPGACVGAGGSSWSRCCPGRRRPRWACCGSGRWRCCTRGPARAATPPAAACSSRRCAWCGAATSTSTAW